MRASSLTAIRTFSPIIDTPSEKYLMSVFVFSLHALLDKQEQQLLLNLYPTKKKLIKCNILQQSSHSSPPIYSSIEPKIKNPNAPDKAINNNLPVSSPFTKGCKKANTTKAIAKFINPLPSSVATFLSLFITLIINNHLRFTR